MEDTDNTNFRDFHIAASLKQGAREHMTAPLHLFPRLPYRGLIEATNSIAGGVANVFNFRDFHIAASLKLDAGTVVRRPEQEFPRLPYRGLIEAIKHFQQRRLVPSFPRLPYRGLIEAPFHVE